MRLLLLLVFAYQVLDARDPEGTRCRFLEQHIRKNARHKHLLLLLNKCDLVSDLLLPNSSMYKQLVMLMLLLACAVVVGYNT